jgi:predicted O-methyltransferase YrrM
MHPLLEASDKQFWHRFVPVYDAELDAVQPVTRILEMGVFKGNSIRWLATRYPDATIHGGDILPVQPEWPVSASIHYHRVDQGSPDQIRTLFDQIGAPLDVIVEDGSHVPLHQKQCLVEGLRHVRPGGLYILEDIHTSHPEHSKYRTQRGEGGEFVGPLHLLLAVEHLKSIGAPLDDTALEELSSASLFTRDEIRFLFARIASVLLFKRATLPHRCYRCGRDDFRYATLRCHCGVELYALADSMTAVLRIAG